MPKKRCSVPKCKLKAEIRGMCKNHYQQDWYRRNGRSGAKPKRVVVAKVADVPPQVVRVFCGQCKAFCTVHVTAGKIVPGGDSCNHIQVIVSIMNAVRRFNLALAGQTLEEEA